MIRKKLVLKINLLFFSTVNISNNWIYASPPQAAVKSLNI